MFTDGTEERGKEVEYVKDSIDSHQIDIPVQTLECVGVTITLSAQMSFILLAVYLKNMKEKKLC